MRLRRPPPRPLRAPSPTHAQKCAPPSHDAIQAVAARRATDPLGEPKRAGRSAARPVPNSASGVLLAPPALVALPAAPPLAKQASAAYRAAVDRASGRPAHQMAAHELRRREFVRNGVWTAQMRRAFLEPLEVSAAADTVPSAPPADLARRQQWPVADAARKRLPEIPSAAGGISTWAPQLDLERLTLLGLITPGVVLPI